MIKGRTVIVGGGLAGLACADRLHQDGAPFLLLEASDDLGGRVRTDPHDGFLLDRGFQVFLSAYPEAGRILDLAALDLRPFKPGALIFRHGKRHRLMDVFRAPRHALSTALQPIGTIRDKLQVGKLRLGAMRKSLESIHAAEDRSTEDYLRRYGFSDEMIDVFFRAFYGGIFLKRDLRTSSRMFEFTFKMFAQGFATLPAKGMQEIPRQLASRLPGETIRVNTPVRSVDQDGVTLADGERLDAEAVVGLPEHPDLEEQVRTELRSWFGEKVEAWTHLRTDRIRRALPEQPPRDSPDDRAGFRIHEGVYVSGDHCTSASIEGALLSGKRVAEAILEARRERPAPR